MTVKQGDIAVYRPRVNSRGNVYVSAHKAGEADEMYAVFRQDGDALWLTLHGFRYVGELAADGKPNGMHRFERIPAPAVESATA